MPEIDKIDDTQIFHYKLDAPGESEMIDRIYDRLTAEMIARYQEENRPLIEYHRHKLQNWVSVQEEQLVIQMSEMVAEAEALGADAIVNIRYASSAIMQCAAEVIAYGTAVKFTK